VQLMRRGFDATRLSEGPAGPRLQRGRVMARWMCIFLLLVPVMLASGVGAAEDLAAQQVSVSSGDRRPGAAPAFPHLGRPLARKELSAALAEEHRQAKQAAWRETLSQGGQPSEQVGNIRRELMAIRGGVVYVMKTLNINAAVSTAVNLLRDAAPYELTGLGQTIGVWDGGVVRASHQEFVGRIGIGDGGDDIDHATHVAGTIAATGVKSRALGMASSARIESYDFDEDLAEVALLAMSYANEPGKIQISNHSYGWVAGWDYSGFFPAWHGTWGGRESDLFGCYDGFARDWDALCYAAPYYLPFKAGGNDRTDTVPMPGTYFDYYTEDDGWQFKEYELNSDPYPDAWDQGGYDTIPSDATAKNVLTIGAIDLGDGGTRDLGKVTMADFSSWGPTDDGRIKPDLVAHGVDIYSPTARSDRSYDVFSGTSMATPAASGTAALLPEFYARFAPDQAMRSATLKALLIHTADDLGNPGPDYQYGWGLVNAQAAVEHIQAHFDFPRIGKIIEETLDLTTTECSYPFVWDGGSPIRVTLVWTDPPATEVEGLDNPTPCLVNDLDIRVIDPQGGVHAPFVLTPAAPADPAATGDNTLDNVEQVWIGTPEIHGRYRVRVTYKGLLTDERQEYSLLLSGQRLSETALADINGDGQVGWLDLEMLAASWLRDEPSLDVVPCGGDGAVNMLDFGDFAAAWNRCD